MMGILGAASNFHQPFFFWVHKALGNVKHGSFSNSSAFQAIQGLQRADSNQTGYSQETHPPLPFFPSAISCTMNCAGSKAIESNHTAQYVAATSTFNLLFEHSCPFNIFFSTLRQ